MYPRNGATADKTLLVWSSNCFSKNAVFLVSHDYSTFHVASGKCIRPQNGKPSDPGDDGKLVLGSTNCYNGFIKFRKRNNTNLVYYTSVSVDVCIGEGRSSTEPKEGDPVIVSKPACTGVSRCQHLTYGESSCFSVENVLFFRRCPQVFLVSLKNSSVQGWCQREAEATTSPTGNLNRLVVEKLKGCLEIFTDDNTLIYCTNYEQLLLI